MPDCNARWTRGPIFYAKSQEQLFVHHSDYCMDSLSMFFFLNRQIQAALPCGSGAAASLSNTLCELEFPHLFKEKLGLHGPRDLFY